jgi:hypothetical protein
LTHKINVVVNSGVYLVTFDEIPIQLV